MRARSAIMGHVGNEQQRTKRNEIMQYGVSVKEFTENGRRYVKVNESVCEVDDTIDRGCLLFNLLYCTPYYFMACHM